MTLAMTSLDLEMVTVECRVCRTLRRVEAEKGPGRGGLRSRRVEVDPD
jgi:hypothetical protein